MYLTYPIICALWDNQLNQDIALFFTILGVFCRIQGQDKSLGPVLEFGICFLQTIFIFHLLLLFLFLLQLLRFLPYLLSHFGIAPSSRVQQLASKGLLGFMSKDNFDCTSCQLGKQPALLFNNNESISNSNFELFHSDVQGPSPIDSISGSRYFVVFINDYSCYSQIFPMKSRFEILPIYNNFAKIVET